jgi:16S rRNA (guanine527-N7)-methyltransferase
MSASLPVLDPSAFAAGLRSVGARDLPPDRIEALYRHYQELSRWSPRLSLIGPGTAVEILERHYGESLAALPFLPPPREALPGAPGEAPVLLDLGSGAGFPGLVLAAARPDLAVWLVEARERKCAFLAHAARRARLSVRCLNARVSTPLPAELPAGLAVVTVRALKVPAEVIGALAERLVGDGRFVFWVGERVPELPTGLAVTRDVLLPGSEQRRILEVRTRSIPRSEVRENMDEP